MGPVGPTGAGCDMAYGGLFNTDSGEFCTQPDEIAAMTFSGRLPCAGVHYDGNHSLVLENDGVYEIQYTLRAASKSRSQLCMAVANDGVPIPCSRVCKDVAGGSDIELSCMAVTEAHAGAHLHLIAYGGNCGCECFMLGEGVNLMLYAKKLGELPDPPPGHDYERGRERGHEREPRFGNSFERERGHDHSPHR